jgi:hypothetical protein
MGECFCKNKKFRAIFISILIFSLIYFVINTIWVSADEAYSVPIEKRTIFVSLASYRDKECPKTLIDLFDKASDPSRIFVGICEQNDFKKDSECYLPKYEKQISRTMLHHENAKGPTYARYLASKLCTKQQFFFQIDSHMRFLKNWDQILIDEYDKIVKERKNNNTLNPENVILTQYPLEYDPTKPANKNPNLNKIPNVTPHTCKAKWDDTGIIIPGANQISRPNKAKPTYFCAGGMIFAPTNILHDVPFDPHLPDLFQGEEFLLSARLWTAGYDMYTPTSNVSFHYYTRKDDPKFWKLKDYIGPSNSLQRVKYILNIPQDTIPNNDILHKKQRYGLGSVRPLDDYYKFIHTDPINKQTGDMC